MVLSSSDSEKPIARPLIIRPMCVVAPIIIPAANGISAHMLDMMLRAQTTPEPREDQPLQFPVWSLEQRIEVFGNRPRPASAALATLNDEGVFMLAQNRKEKKVLGGLERAVAICRALICKSLFIIPHGHESSCDA